MRVVPFHTFRVVEAPEPIDPATAGRAHGRHFVGGQLARSLPALRCAERALRALNRDGAHYGFAAHAGGPTDFGTLVKLGLKKDWLPLRDTVVDALVEVANAIGSENAVAAKAEAQWDEWSATPTGRRALDLVEDRESDYRSTDDVRAAFVGGFVHEATAARREWKHAGKLDAIGQTYEVRLTRIKVPSGPGAYQRQAADTCAAHLRNQCEPILETVRNLTTLARVAAGKGGKRWSAGVSVTVGSPSTTVAHRSAPGAGIRRPR